MAKKVYLGMSGGVDSSVSAMLLKDQGYNVTGIYMKNWSKDLPGMKCPWAEDLADAKRVAVQCDIDFEVWDYEREYKQKVVDYMLAEFQKGRTPNPDVICNELVKFKLFYDEAMRRGADYIATGHYARVSSGCNMASERRRVAGNSDAGLSPGWTGSDLRDDVKNDEQIKRNDERSTEPGIEMPDRTRRQTIFSNSCECPNNTYLLRSVDENKDQTYFLYRMSDAATAKTLFPVGGYTKPEVKKLAEHYGLDVAHKKESMGVCFVGEVGMKDFLKEYCDTQPGEIREIESGQTLGYHDGAIFYTIGQRHGLYLGGGLPYYVVKKDLKANIVYVSRNLNYEGLWSKELTLEDIHLRNGLTLDDLSETPNLQVRLRHRAPLITVERVGSECTPLKETKRASTRAAKSDGPVRTGAGAGLLNVVTLTLHFQHAIKRPAAGQSAVLYSGEVCLGGGIITE